MVKESKLETSAELHDYYSRISVRFSHVLRPFNGFDFTSTLERLGYTITIPPPPSSGVPNVTATMGYMGVIGVKDQFIFDINSEKQFFGIMGPDIKSLLSEFIIIFNELERESIIIQERVLFFEYQGRYDYKLFGISPIEMLHNNGVRAPLIKKVRENMHRETGLFHCSLTKKGESPDNTDFFEIVFRPIPSRVDDIIGIQIINRNHDFDSFEKHVESIETQIEALIQDMLI